MWKQWMKGIQKWSQLSKVHVSISKRGRNAHVDAQHFGEQEEGSTILTLMIFLASDFFVLSHFNCSTYFAMIRLQFGIISPPGIYRLHRFFWLLFLISSLFFIVDSDWCSSFCQKLDRKIVFRVVSCNYDQIDVVYCIHGCGVFGWLLMGRNFGELQVESILRCLCVCLGHSIYFSNIFVYCCCTVPFR